MTINEFNDYVNTGNALDNEDIHMYKDYIIDARSRLT